MTGAWTEAGRHTVQFFDRDAFVHHAIAEAGHGSAQAQPDASAAIAEPVYVIDDDAHIRRALARLLCASDRQARTFESAECFLAALNGLAKGCVLADIQLPGMNGLALIGRLREARPSWPIVAMSGSGDDNAEREALRLGVRAFLRKPFDSQAMLAAVGPGAPGTPSP